MEESKLKLIAEPFRTLLRQLITRCEKAGIEHELKTFLEKDYYLMIYLPSGRDRRIVYVFDLDSQKLSQVEFEKYVFIEGYQSICCYRDGSIEAYIRLLRRTKVTPLFWGLLNISYGEKKKMKKVFEVKHQAANENPITLTISQPTNTMLALSGRELDEGSGLTIKIAGLKIFTNQEATAILEKLANSLFFQIESSIGFPLMLETYYETPRIMPIRKKAAEPLIGFPKYEYDRDPLNLYWYANSAYGMPLLQFLAYYQVLEFYFPTYSRKEASRTVANILKAPNFSADRDLDVGKVISAVLSKMGRSYADEKQQLSATIQACVQKEEIREFIEERDSIKEHFKDDYKKLSTIKISIDNKDLDLRDQIVKRLYDIRCRIVHTKAGEIEGERIIPFTEEESLLPIETAIIEFIARKALIAGSSKLSI